MLDRWILLAAASCMHAMRWLQQCKLTLVGMLAHMHG
jgi:hypothetical protein